MVEKYKKMFPFKELPSDNNLPINDSLGMFGIVYVLYSG